MQKTVQWQLVGPGNVLVMTIPGDVPVSVAISDDAFVEAMEKLIEQAKHYPGSKLRVLRVENGR